MARVTIDDCLEKIPNRFMLVIAAAKRARQLHQGAQPLVRCKNKEAVTALREIAQGFIEVALSKKAQGSQEKKTLKAT
jgi:DNA-directed RNA polymerase subunit omega